MARKKNNDEPASKPNSEQPAVDAKLPGDFSIPDYQPPGDAADDAAEPQGGFTHAARKVRKFPQSPGVYFMKDRFGVVIYIGKAKNLRSRAGSYFLKRPPRTTAQPI